MAVRFSKVTLTADNGNTASFLCSGCPKDNYDLEEWTIYQKFMSDNQYSEKIRAEVETYIYGEGELFEANEYEIAAFTGRGIKFLHHPNVHWRGISEFMVYPSLLNVQNFVEL